MCVGHCTECMFVCIHIGLYILPIPVPLHGRLFIVAYNCPAIAIKVPGEIMVYPESPSIMFAFPRASASSAAIYESQSIVEE